MTVPAQSFDIFTGEVSVEEGDFEEDVSQAYVYWNPNNQLAFGADYRLERFERENGFFGAEGIGALDTHNLSLQLKYFHPSGWSTTLRSTYIDQRGLFSDPFNLGQLVEGKDNFWLVDVSASYRLPNKRGIISIDVRNLFDKDFRYQDIDPGNPRYLPELAVFGKLTLTF